MTTTAGRGPHSLSASTEQLLDSAPDGVVIIDQRGMIRLVNRQAEALFGYERQDMIGQLVEMLIPGRVGSLHPAHRDGYFAHPTTRPMGAGLELTARRKDGSEFPVDISLSSLETDEGVLVSAAVRDITERKNVEEEQERLKSELVRAQREEDRAVAEAKLHQSQRLESVGQLAGGVANDFNNLLAGIMNYAALVADGLEEQAARLGLADDEAFATLTKDVREITNVAGRAALLTRQLLIFSRREVVKPEVLDLNSIVVEMEKLLRRTIGENVALVVVLAPDLPSVEVDRGQFEQVLMNLAVNARDAMDGGGALRIETSADDGSVHLNVTDTGSGMPREVASRAFEPFFTTKPKGEGAGLGLATVYGIATQARGEVTISSDEGRGTTVRVSIPATRGRTEPVHHAPQARNLSASGETILLVEDEDMVRTPLLRMLQRNGYAVLESANAEDAIRLVRDHSDGLDLLLTDVVLPGRSGKELAAEILRLSPSTEVLFMSGYTSDVIVHRGVLDEGVRLIEKPFSAESLLSRIRDILDEPRS